MAAGGITGPDLTALPLTGEGFFVCQGQIFSPTNFTMGGAQIRVK